MPIDDPNSWAHGATAFRQIFDGLRSAIGLVRDIRASGATAPAEQKLVDEALSKAEVAANIAEAEIAKALGFELCKCRFPPVAMLTVGHHLAFGGQKSGPVFECPRCGFNTAAPFNYTRIAPAWTPPASSAP
jgi:hypothetical protein